MLENRLRGVVWVKDGDKNAISFAVRFMFNPPHSFHNG
jgi:hypothetical protein